MKESEGAKLLKELLAELPEQDVINHWNSILELDLEGPTFDELFSIQDFPENWLDTIKQLEDFDNASKGEAYKDFKYAIAA